jgi:hypothetical protein
LGEFVDEGVELFQPDEVVRGTGQAPDHFSNRLLERVNLRFHHGKTNSCGANRQLTSPC